jgi:hypothetical protein
MDKEEILNIIDLLKTKWKDYPSILFLPQFITNPSSDLLNLFCINLEVFGPKTLSGVIIIYINCIEIYLHDDTHTEDNYFDIEFNYFNINSILELILNGIFVEDPNFKDKVLSKSREDKIYLVLNN